MIDITLFFILIKLLRYDDCNILFPSIPNLSNEDLAGLLIVVNSKVFNYTVEVFWGSVNKENYETNNRFILHLTLFTLSRHFYCSPLKQSKYEFTHKICFLR